MRDLTILGDKMFTVLEQLEKGEIKPDKAKQMIEVSNTIINVSKVQLDAVKQHHKMNAQAAKMQQLPEILGLPNNASAEAKTQTTSPVISIVEKTESKKFDLDKNVKALSPDLRKYAKMTKAQVKNISSLFEKKIAFSIKQGFRNTSDAISHYGSKNKFEDKFNEYINS